MLRAKTIVRESSSICAFCQHRLYSRPATPRNKRQFSITRNLREDDGWGGWGVSKSKARPQQDDFLSQHELSARQQLLAKQQPNLAPEPPKPKPTDHGLHARHIWDVRKQQEVEASLRRDGITFRSDGPMGRGESIYGRETRMRPSLPVREVSLEFNSPDRRRGDVIRRGIIPRNASDFAERPGDASTTQATNRGSRLGDNTIYSSRPSNSTIYRSRDRTPPSRSGPTMRWESSSDTDNKERDPEPKSRAGLEKAIYPPDTSKDASDWGLLTRKRAPEKANSEDFWAAMDKNTNVSRGAKVQDPSIPGTTPRSIGSKDAWADMERKIRDNSSSSNALYDWGKEYDKVKSQRKESLRGASPKQAETPSEVAHETEAQSREREYRGRSRDRDRDRRVDRFEQRDNGVAGRGKRSRRGGFRFGGDEDEGGFDYEQYQEKRRLKAQRKAQREAERVGPIPILLPELINIRALAEALKVEPKLFLSQLGELGFESVTLDSLMTGDTAALVAQEYGFEPTVEAGADRDLKPLPPPEDPSTLPQRPPVVTIMGHVDHGKTTLLDYLRKSSIAAQEHGGITQRIGAFSVNLSSGKPITFLDTPGHAAFLTMRQRGAYVTDIVVLVVAADDSIKPQTIEAIKHARGAKVPMIVAISKIDKDGARVDQVKHDLAREGVEIEDFGGEVQVVCVSGKTGQGMDDLEENILTLSEILDYRAEVDGPAEGWILESSLKPIGKAATVLVKRGTLRPGDYIAAGLTWARIRHLRNEAGVDIDEAPPGTPVEILGWKDLPVAGDQVIQAPDEGRAKDAVEYREGLRDREKDAAAHEEISEARKALQEKRAREKAAAGAGRDADEAESLPEEENGTKMVNFAVKGDLHGSVEAVCAAIQELGSHEVRPRILRSGTGPIHEFDVEHAATSKSVIVNFATPTPGYIRQMAEENGVQILDHTVIYHLVDDVKANLSQHLAPDISSRVLGEAEVLQIFPINIKGRKYKNIAGCRVRNGIIARNRLFRIYRAGEKIFDGKLETLKHLKKDVTEMGKGTECGIGFEEFQDFEVGDQIQAYEEVTTQRSL